MKTKILFATALLAVSGITSADTLSNLLNDIPKNVSTVEKTGTCDANIEQESNVWKSTDDSCEPVVVECGKGKTILPSKCEVTYSEGLGRTGYLSSSFESNHTDFVANTLSCNVQMPYAYPPMEGYAIMDVTIKATARCIKTPANLIQNTAKKLGITIK